MDSSIRSLPSTARRIDIHHHFLPPSFVDALAQSDHPAAAKVTALGWSPERSLAMMDASGVETAIVSLSLPGASFDGAANPAALARQGNEVAARMMADYPGRFGAFASLPMLDARAAMTEVEYALDTLKLDGVMLLSNVRGRYLGDAAFDPLLAELDRRRAIVFLHPNRAPSPGWNDFVEFPHEVTRALASLTESGGIERYPRIRYILAYGGGTIPFIAARVTVVGMDVFGNLLTTMIRYLKRARTMQRMNYDLTASTDPFAWRALYGQTKPTRILMGSNYPWTPPAVFARQQAQLRGFEDLDPPRIEAIERANALKLFPRFA
jgi:predicted TIM-barrel fold metal-dependent hydrolase